MLFAPRAPDMTEFQHTSTDGPTNPVFAPLDVHSRLLAATTPAKMLFSSDTMTSPTQKFLSSSPRNGNADGHHSAHKHFHPYMNHTQPRINHSHHNIVPATAHVALNGAATPQLPPPLQASLRPLTPTTPTPLTVSSIPRNMGDDITEMTCF